MVNVELRRTKGGRWKIGGVGIVWENKLVEHLKEIVEEEDEWL